MKREYRALTGINYPDGKGGEARIDRGDPVPEALVDAAPWLLEQRAVELLSDAITAAGPAMHDEHEED